MHILRKFSAPIMALTLSCGHHILAPSNSFGDVTFANGFGVSAGASTASDCPSFCTGDFDFDSGGGEGAGYASATSTAHGSSRARAYYSSTDSYLPELKAFSSSSAGKGGSASAFGVQGFLYEGTESGDITIEFELDASVFDSGSYGSESVAASIGVLGVNSIMEPDAPINGPDYYSDFGTWYYENFGSQLGTDSLFVNTPNGSEIGSITFDVSPGDVFFVGASLQASSRTGTADAFNTFTSTFSDSSQAFASQLTVANAVAAVPEPASMAMLSVVAVSWTARRRRRGSDRCHPKTTTKRS